jgi:hypothetical protein
MNRRFLILICVGVVLGACLFSASSQVVPQGQKQKEKKKQKDEPPYIPSNNPLKFPRAKAEALEQELVKAFPPVIDDPGIRRVIIDGDPEAALRRLVPTPLPVIPKPCVITAGDVDNFQYTPQTDQVSPCCLTGVRSRNFDEPGVNNRSVTGCGYHAARFWPSGVRCASATRAITPATTAYM